MLTQSYILTQDQKTILKTVLYFDVFKYPLKPNEIYENSDSIISQELFYKELAELCHNSLLRKNGDFILTNEASDSIIERRIKGNKGAEEIFPTAYRYSKKIASFPFVEGICLSGGISKNYYDENGDLDFFIITQPNRVWICRTLLILRYKFLPKHKKKYWCVNYFISPNNLEIPDKNQFTSTELAYLIPTVNYPLYQAILSNNNWFRKHFPNKQDAPSINCIDTPKPLVKKIIEKITQGAFGNKLDDFLLTITLNHWRRKYPKMSEEDFHLQFRSRKDVCKRHTFGHQNRVLNLWEEKMKHFETNFQLKLI